MPSNVIVPTPNLTWNVWVDSIQRPVVTAPDFETAQLLVWVRYREKVALERSELSQRVVVFRAMWPQVSTAA